MGSSNTCESSESNSCISNLYENSVGSNKTNSTSSVTKPSSSKSDSIDPKSSSVTTETNSTSSTTKQSSNKSNSIDQKNSSGTTETSSTASATKQSSSKSNSSDQSSSAASASSNRGLLASIFDGASAVLPAAASMKPPLKAATNIAKMVIPKKEPPKQKGIRIEIITRGKVKYKEENGVLTVTVKGKDSTFKSEIIEY